MESALDGHPEIVVSTYPGGHIEVGVVCQELNLARVDVETFTALLREGEGKFETAYHGGGDVAIRKVEEDPFVLVIDGPDGILNLHTLDVTGFIEKLNEATAAAAVAA